jgi:hypothetical protein
MKTETTYLQLTDNYRVSRDDERNLLLEEFKVVKSAPNRHQTEYKETERWVSMGFFSDMKCVARRLLKESISNSLNNNLNDLISVIDDSTKELTEAIEQAGITLNSFPEVKSGRGRKPAVEVAKVDVDNPKKRGRPRKADVAV